MRRPKGTLRRYRRQLVKVQRSVSPADAPATPTVSAAYRALVNEAVSR